MELEDLKNNWIILNERLEKNEMINRKIIYEMISKRTYNAHNNLLRRHVSGFVLMLVMGVLFLWGYLTKTMTIKTEAWVLLECMILMGLCMQGIFIFYLYRFDLVNDSILRLNQNIIKYRVWIRMGNIVSRVISGIGIVLFFIIQQTTITTNGIAFLLLILGLASLSFIIGTRFYKRNLQRVEEGLKELEEFRNESVE